MRRRERLALEAMATRFELVLEGDDPVHLRAAGEEALREIERLDARLSRYQPASVVSALNARAAAAPVQVDAELIDLLLSCAEVTTASEGAFDVSVGALVAVWRRAAAAGQLPDARDLASAGAASGMRHVIIDPAAGSVRFLASGLSLDLGAAGKGYAIDCATERLRDAGVEHALLHGGTSSVQAIGTQADGRPWPVTWEARPGHPSSRVTFDLNDEALAISATHGRSFVVGNREFGHVVDPRTAEPLLGTRSAAVRGARSLQCDMLSTALLVRGPEWRDELAMRWPGYSGDVTGARGRL